MRAKLDFGAEIDFLTKGELHDELDRIGEIWRQYAFGLKHIRLPVQQATVDSYGNLNIGGTNVGDQIRCGPNEGYVWRVLRVSVFGPSLSQQVSLYIGDPSPSRYVDTFSACWTTSRGLLLKQSDYLSIQGSGLTTGTVCYLSGEAVEAPAEQIYKLIGG